MTKIAVIYFTLYGHTLSLSETAVKAATEAGAEAKLFQVPETLSAEVLAKLGAAPKRTDVPEITPDDLKAFDGFIFVIPTRYGRSVAQVSAFFDHTGGLWMTQALNSKFATIITSTGTQNGGQETTALTTLPFFAHHGINYVPVGYLAPDATTMEEIKGGSPWGTGTLAGADGSRQPSALEIKSVAFHASHFTGVVHQFTRGGLRLKAEAEHGGSVKPKAVTQASQQSTSSTGKAPSDSSMTSSQKKKKGIWSSIKKAFK